MELEELKTGESAPPQASSEPEIGPDGIPLELPGEGLETPPNSLEVKPEDAENIDDAGLPPDYTPSKFDEPGRVRRFATILNLLNSLLGAGILGVPGSMQYAGVVPSLLLLVLVAVLSHVSACLTLKLQKRTGAAGLDDLALIVTKKTGQIILSVLTIAFAISCCVAYVVIGTDSILSWLRLAGLDCNTFGKRAIVVAIYALFVPVALTIPKSLKILSYLSFVTFVAIIYYVIFTIIKAIIVFPSRGMAEIVIARFDIGLFNAISVFGLAFALPVVILPIVSKYNKDVYKREVVSAAAVALTFLLVASSGTLGYLMEGTNAKDNLLNAYPDDDVLTIICRIGFFFVVSFSYPCLIQSAIASFSWLIYKENDASQLDTKKRILVLICSNVLPYIISICLPNAGPALSIGGALGGGLVDFFYPSLMWILMSKKKWYHWQNILCILLALFGLVTAGISTYLSVVDAINSFS